MKTETIPVYGMMCEHCVKAVTMALDDIEGVSKHNNTDLNFATQQN